MTISRGWLAFERGTLWAIELDGGGVPGSVSPRVTAVFDEVRRDSAGSLAVAMGLTGSEPVLQRFATGRRCFAAWIQAQIAAYGWVSHADECIGEMEREFHLQAGDAYIWDCATLPSYRRQGLYSALLSHIVAELRREGTRRAWIGSSLANRPSIRGFANAGFRPVVGITYGRLFSLCCLWVSRDPGAPDALVAGAHQALIGDHERTWGALVVGRSGRGPTPACAQIGA